MLNSPLCSIPCQEITESSWASRLINLSLLMGVYFIMLLGFILLIATALLLLGYSISIFTVLLSIVFSFILLWIAAHYCFKITLIKTFFISLMVIILILLSNIISGMFYDTSFDGQWYHQIAIMKLIDGWNPIYQTKTDEVYENNNSEADIVQIRRFPKGSWICAASFFKLINNLESCKSINLFLIIASFFLSLAACLSLGEGLSLVKSLIISSLVALNPVSICQSLSFYVDGQLASTISCIFALLFLLYRRPHWLISLALSMCLIILINLKFTGIVYALVLGVGFSALFMLLREKLTGIKVMNAFLLGILLGTFFVGYNPYVVNTLTYSNPFYPILTHNIILNNRPANFNKLNRFEAFAYSILSASSNSYGSNPAQLKVPFNLSLKEIIVFQNMDVRTGGFGPFFGGVFSVAIIALVISLAYGLIGATEAIALSFIIFISIFSITEPWWARFAPQVWLIPIILIILLLYNDKYLMSKVFGWSIVVILSINILLIGAVYVGVNAYRTIKLNRALTSLAHLPHPVHVYFEWPSARIKLEKMGIRYEEVASPEKFNCSHPINIPYIGAKFCPE